MFFHAFSRRERLRIASLFIVINESIPNPLHIFEQDFLAAPIIELGGAAIGVADEHDSLFGSSVLGKQARLLCPETRRHPGRGERLS